jgi:hypothetical protein
MTDVNYGKQNMERICLGISFLEYTPGKSYKYSLRFNASEG